MVRVIDLTTKDTKNHEKNIGRGLTQIGTDKNRNIGKKTENKRRVSREDAKYAKGRGRLWLKTKGKR